MVDFELGRGKSRAEVNFVRCVSPHSCSLWRCIIIVAMKTVLTNLPISFGLPARHLFIAPNPPSLTCVCVNKSTHAALLRHKRAG